MRLQYSSVMKSVTLIEIEISISCLEIFLPVGYQSGFDINVSGTGIITDSFVAGSLEAV